MLFFPPHISTRTAEQHPSRAIHYNATVMKSLLILVSAKFKYTEKEASHESHYQSILCPTHFCVFFHIVFKIFTALQGRYSGSSISRVSASMNSVDHKSKSIFFLKIVSQGPGRWLSG